MRCCGEEGRDHNGREEMGEVGEDGVERQVEGMRERPE